MHKQIIPALLALSAASILGVVLVAFRWLNSGAPAYFFLIWNLFLAWLPLLAALPLPALRRFPLLAVPLGIGWLLFLPNAPYLLTDLLHLGRWGDVPFWYDLLLLLVFAVTGLLLGFVSLKIVHALVAQLLGRVSGWLFAISALSLSSLGVYIGRFLRWNSWDALLNPQHIIADLLALLQQPWLHRQAYAFSLGLAVVLICGYVVLYTTPHMMRPVAAQESRNERLFN